MSARHEFSDNLLHAFVDGQLQGEDRKRLLSAMEADADLSERVCALRRTKDWVNIAFEGVQAPQHSLRKIPAPFNRNWLCGLAASMLLLATGFLFGWTVSSSAQEPLHAVVLRDLEAGTHKVVLHIDRSDKARFDEVLDGAEELLRNYRDKGMEVDVLANAGGVDLLRSDVSPYAQRVARMISEYDNLHFIACTNTLQRLREKGIQPLLIDHTQQDSTTVEHIIHRLQQGWAYIRV